MTARPYACLFRKSNALLLLTKQTQAKATSKTRRECAKLLADERQRRAGTAATARDRDPVVGVRELGHPLPRLPVAGRRPRRSRADRRRRARPSADRLLPE